MYKVTSFKMVAKEKEIQSLPLLIDNKIVNLFYRIQIYIYGKEYGRLSNYLGV